MLNEFSRTELLIGKEALQNLAARRVAVFGVGGVGSYAAEGLVRSGVGKLVLIDDACICFTNLNRQIQATHHTVGRPKVDVMRERIKEINPRAEVEIRHRFYLPEAAEELLRSDYDYIIDAVDTVTAKVDLAVQAYRLGIPIISSMGAGNKMDPTRFEVSDIYATSVCPLAKVMRKELRNRQLPGLKVVYSKEIPLSPLYIEETNCAYDCVCAKGSAGTCTTKRHIPGSMSFVPSVAGLILAGEVVKDLIGYKGT